MDRAAGSGLEVKPPQDPEVYDQAKTNKYQLDNYWQDRATNPPVAGQHGWSHQPDAKRTNRHRGIWALAVIAIVSLSIALGAGLGAGLAAQHKPSSPTAASTISSNASNTPAADSQSDGSAATLTSPPTTAPTSGCPATNGSTYIATNKPSPTEPSQITATSLPFEILCNHNSADIGSITDMQLIGNVSSLEACMDACALYNFQTKTVNFPAHACTGVSWGYGLDLSPRHICWLKSGVTLGSPNNTATWPGYDGAVLLLDS